MGNDGDYGYAPSIVALPGIGFAVTWQQGASSLDADRTVLAQILDVRGKPIGALIELATDAERGMPSVAGTADGHVIFSWNSDDGDAAGNETTVFQVLSGAAGKTQIDGTGGRDLIFGSTANETIAGGQGKDILTGGGGNDTFVGSIQALSGDWITDFALGDTIRFLDVDAKNLNASVDGGVLKFTGGSLKIGELPAGAQISVSDAPGGGVNVTLVTIHARDDFNGDGISDILWRNDSGTLSNWLGNSKGGFSPNDGAAMNQVATSWKIAGTGDFNGDGKVDLLWRNSDGKMSDWLAGAGGGFTGNDGVALVQVSNDWQIAGIGDFNGDGRSDILWRSSTGSLSDWLGRADGGFNSNDANAMHMVDTKWHIAGTGDFNGDGRSDIVWRHDDGGLSDWLGTAAGGFAMNDANAMARVGTDWNIAGIGDFNGDGFDDLLWRNDDGSLSNWLGTASGGFRQNDANAFTKVGNDWKVAAVADYNGDGRDDILWRNDDGHMSNWLGTAAGGFVANDQNAFNSVPVSWHIAALAHVMV